MHKLCYCGILLLATVSVGGCYTGVRAREAKADDVVQGLPYFLPAPYLEITELPGNRWDAQIRLAADRGRTFYLQPKTIFAKNDFDITFHPDGTLKTFKLDQDATAVSEALVTALKDIELRRLELEQERREKEQERREKDRQDGNNGESPTLEDDDDQKRRTTDTRAFFVYRIEGKRLVGVLPGPERLSAEGSVQAPPAGAARTDTSSRPLPSLTADPRLEVRVDRSTSHILISRRSPVFSGIEDFNDLVFYRDSDRTSELEPEAVQRVRDEARYVEEGKFFAVPQAVLSDVKHLGLR